MAGLTVLMIFVAMLGACIGSFLNVVIYRLPRELSTRQPKRSFCPACRTSIAWYDNLPVISWLCLHGRCRHCQGTISGRYPVIELLGAAIAVGLFDLMFIAGARTDVNTLTADWPIFLAHAILFWALIAEAGIDVEHYSIDLRITWLVVGIGIIAHIAWTPTVAEPMLSASPTTALASLAAILGLIISALAFKPLPIEEPLDLPEAPTPQTNNRPSRAWLIAILTATTAVTILAILPIIDAVKGNPAAHFDWRVLLTTGLGFCIIVGASLIQRPADDQIVDAIEAERHNARRLAISELARLLPAAILAIAAVAILHHSPTAQNAWQNALAWSPTGTWQPLAGLATAITGFVIAGAIGWTVRIIFTVALGKEAFGAGDIHLMAAAGAVAGWPVVLIGFFMASPLALLGVIALLIRKTSRAIPFGPWLSLGLWLAVLYHDRVAAWMQPMLTMLAGNMD